LFCSEWRHTSIHLYELLPREVTPYCSNYVLRPCRNRATAKLLFAIRDLLAKFTLATRLFAAWRHPLIGRIGIMSLRPETRNAGSFGVRVLCLAPRRAVRRARISSHTFVKQYAALKHLPMNRGIARSWPMKPAAPRGHPRIGRFLPVSYDVGRC